MGETAINFPDMVFPNPVEKYTGVHDAPYVHVLILEDTHKYIFVSFDLIDPAGWDEHRNRLAEKFKIKPDYIMLHTSHAVSTPHSGRPEEFVTDREKEGRKLFHDAIHQATEEAASEAEKNLKSAVFGIGYAESHINASRVLDTKKGCIQAANEKGKSDHTIPVLSIKDAEDGKYIGILFNVNTAPSVLENSKEGDTRLVSGDMASPAERMIKRITGAPAAYTTGASADQCPILTAVWDYMDDMGNMQKMMMPELGFSMSTLLGMRLASSVLQILPDISCSPVSSGLHMCKKVFALPGHMPFPPKSKNLPFVPGPDVQSEVYFFYTDQTVIIGCRQEVCVSTLQNIRTHSPFQNTILLDFFNGMAGYMVTKDLYEKNYPSCRKGNFAAGAAEVFEKYIIEFLMDLKG